MLEEREDSSFIDQTLQYTQQGLFIRQNQTIIYLNTPKLDIDKTDEIRYIVGKNSTVSDL